MFRAIDPVVLTTLQSYEHRQLWHRARRYIYIKGMINGVIVLLFLLTFPPELRPRMVAIVLADALFLVPYWFLVQRYPTLATYLSLGITSLAISAGDWVGGYQTGASGILYALLILGGHLVLIKPLNTYLLSVLVTAIYTGTIALEVNGVIPIHFPFTLSNLTRVVSLNVISMFGLTILTGVVTRLYRELLQRNKELFALNAISTAANQSLHLDEVLQLTLDKVLQTMELEGGGLYLLEASAGEMVLKFHRNLTEEFIEQVSRMEVERKSFTDSPPRAGQVLVMDDLSQHPVVNRIVGDGNGHRPLAIVPLKAGDRMLGTMNLLGRTGYSFTSQDAELLNTIGAQIGMVIENARLYEIEQDRRQMAESLREIMGVIGSTLELDEVLHLILEQLQKVIDYDTSSVMMLEGDRLQVIAVEGFTNPEEVLKRSYTVKEAGLSREAIRKKRALVVADVTKYARWIYEPQSADVRAWIGAPLIAEGEVIGILTVNSYQVGKYSQDDAQLVMTFAKQAALAVKNARLFRKTKQRFEETIALYQTSLDIPERKRAQELLRIKSHTIESAITGIAIAGFEGNLTYVNPTFVKMWGYDDENEVLGRHGIDFWQNKEKAQEVVEALRGEGNFIGELVAKRKDGSLFDIQLSGSIVADEIGKPICMMASFVDITDRKRAEEALRESEERYRSLIESARDIIYTVSMEGTITSLNPAFETTTDWSRTEWIGKPLTSIVHPDDWPLASEMFQRMLHGETPPLHEVRFRSKSGEYRVGEFMITPHIQHGTMVGILGVGRDITERKRVEAELRRYRNRLEELVEERTAELIKANEQLQREIAERKQTEEILRYSQEKTARSHRLLLALSQAAQAVQRVRTPEEVYYTVGDEMASLDYHAMVFTLLADDGGHLALTHMTFEPGLVRAAEKLTGLSAQGYRFPLVPGGLIQRFIAEGETTFFEPVTELIAEAVPGPVRPLADQLAAMLGLKQAIWAPLSVGGQMYGLLSMAGAGLTEADMPAVTAFANQMAIAIENSRLYQMERKRTAQLAMINQIARQAASILELDQLLHEAVTAIQQSFDYHHVGLFLLDEAAGELKLQAIAGGFADMAPPDHRLALGEGLTGWAAETGQTLLANDVSQEPRYVLGLLKEALTKAELCVALKLAGRVMGVLDVQCTRLNAFDENDLLAMETLADQIAIAIENARLFGETSRRLEEMTALYQISLDIIAQLEMLELLESIVKRAVTLLQAEGGGIYLYDPEREELKLDIGCGHDEKFVGTILKPGEGMAGKVFQTGEPLIVDDYRTWEGRASVYEADQPFSAVLGLPLKWQDRTIGSLAIDANAQERTFNQDDVWLATLFANQAAIAIENARIYGEERKRTTQLELIGGVTQKIASILDLDELLRQVVHLVGDTFGYYRTSILLVNAASDELVFRAVSSPFETLIGHLRLKIGQEGITGWVAHSGKPLLVNDVSLEPRYYPVKESKDTKSELAVPIKLKGEIIGVLDVQSVELDAFGQDDIFILQTLADQLATPIENARLYEAERQQLHRLEELAAASRRITADLDLTSVLEEIVTQTLTTLEADRAAIFLIDLETDRISHAHSIGLSPEYIDEISRRYREVPSSLVLNSTGPVHILDAQADPSTEILREPILREGYHTLAILPLIGRGKTVGALTLYRDAIRAFSPELLALAQSFANQAAVAIENARLYQQTDENLQSRVRELSALYAISEVMTRPLDLDKVLQLALGRAIEVAGMDSGGILLLDPSINELSLRAHQGGSPELIRAVSHTKADEGLMPRMLNSVSVIEDLSEVTKGRRVAIEKEGLQSLVSIPLKAKASPLGVMVLASRSRRTFAPQELELLAAIGNEVGLAVDRANLQAQELRAAILEERQAMAQHMHDDIAQTLSYLGLQMDSVMNSSSLAQNVEAQAELEEMRKAIEDAYENVRSSITRLEEDVPSHLDLEAALPKIISQFEKQAKCRVELQVDRSQLSRLPTSVAFQAAYIISEALTNVRKHAGADSVHLTLQSLEDGTIKVTIQDNGRGFDLDSEQQSGGGGFGLRFMRKRAERAGGSLRIESQPGQGTQLIVTLPSS
jgi:PAS domain S-box-containing protein